MAVELILKDKDYAENNVAVKLTKKEERDVCTIYDVTLHYDKHVVSKEIALFEEDVQLMHTYKLKDNVLSVDYFYFFSYLFRASIVTIH